MHKIKKFKAFTLVVFSCFSIICYSQSALEVIPSHNNETCNKGAMGIQIPALQTSDNYTVTWSTGQTWSNGQTPVWSINELSAGDYSVRVIVKNVTGTLTTTKLDQTLNITIEKEDCKVSISNHFTPNSDAYNDFWGISNTIYYPNFELYVFNKWGQRVHSQKGTYTAWDGTWGGVNVPDGTYYYVFYFDGGNKSKLLKGDLTILR